MSEKKRKFNPWVPVVIMGVVAILFSVYALQSQSDLIDVRKEFEPLRRQAAECAAKFEQQQKREQELVEALNAAKETIRLAEERASKSTKRK